MRPIRDLAGRLRVDSLEVRVASEEAAETLAITARLKTLGLIDKVTEPLGGAHRDHAAMMVTLESPHRDVAPGKEQPDALPSAPAMLPAGKFAGTQHRLIRLQWFERSPPRWLIMSRRRRPR